LRDDRRELRFQQIAGFIRKLTGEPLVGFMRALRFLQRWEEVLHLVGGDDFPRAVEQHFLAGEIIAEEDEGGAKIAQQAPPSGLPAISSSSGEIGSSVPADHLSALAIGESRRDG
jgi:hypothetical protein